jgi:hypothetical protein
LIAHLQECERVVNRGRQWMQQPTKGTRRVGFQGVELLRRTHPAVCTFAACGPFPLLNDLKLQSRGLRGVTAKLLISGSMSGTPLEIDSKRRNHGHSCGNQASRTKFEKQLGKLQHQLNGIRAAAKALGDSTNRELKGVKKRVLSAAGRAAIAMAAKKRGRRLGRRQRRWHDSLAITELVLLG